MAAQVLDRFTTLFDFRTDSRGLNRLESRIRGIQDKLNTISVVGAAMGAALTAAAGFSVRAFAEVESELAKIEGLVGISREQLDAWGDDINRIAVETGQSSADVVRALFFITSAGFRGAEAMDILEMSAKAAAAGLGNQQTIADLLTSALGVYSDGSLSAAGATDQLVAAIREGKLEPSTLASALAKVLPFAQAVGVEFGEVAGAMAAMSRQGIGASRGATALRAVFAKLLKPTETGRKALEEVGLTIDDVRKTVAEEGLIQGLRTLSTAFAGNSDALARVFESEEALLGVLALTGTAAAENAEIIGRVSAAAGDLDKALQPVLNTLSFRWRQTTVQFGNNVEDIGARLAPFAHQMMDLAQTALNWYEALGDGPKDFLAGVLALGPPLIAAAAGAKGLSFALGLLLPSAKTVGLAVGVLTGAFRALTVAIRANPIAFLVGTLVALVVYWDDVTAAIRRAGEIFTSTLEGWGVPVGGIFDWLVDSWRAVLDFLSGPEDDESVIAWVWRGVTGPFQWLADAWYSVLTFLAGTDTGQAVISWLWQARADVFAWVKAAWDSALNYISVPIAGLWDWLRSDPPGLFYGIKFAWDEALSYLETPFSGIFGWIADAWRSVMDSLWGLVPAPIRRLLDGDGSGILDTITDSVDENAGEPAEATRGALQRVRDLLPFSDAREGPLSRLTEAGRSIMRTIAAGVSAAAPNLEAAFRDGLAGMTHIGAPLPVGPPITRIQEMQRQAQLQAQPETGNRVNLSIERIEIVAGGGSPQEIATGITDALRDQVRRAVERADSQVMA